MVERDLRAAKAEAEDRAAEIKTLTAELAALRSSDAANTPDSKVALRARLTGLQTQSDQQTELIRKLRAELAAANERLALQGAHFMEQMRRLGAGTLPASGAVKRSDPQPRVSLAERVANSRGPSGGAVNGDGAHDAGGLERADTTTPSGTPRLIDRISSLSKV